MREKNGSEYSARGSIVGRGERLARVRETANRSLHPLLHYLRRLGGIAGAGALEDAQLLRRFLDSRDESAFTMIVQRYGAMVWGLCVRRLGETPEAEDAFQATFLVLVRKAASLHGPQPLGPWLYGVANRTALKLRGKRARQSARETALPEQLADQQLREMRVDLRPILDEEINRLPTKYRLPVVLCYLQGMSNEEAARQLGCAKGTIFSRLSRARDLLRRRLIRRGLEVSAGALATSLAENVSLRAAPSLALREITIRTSLLLATGTAGQSLSAPLAALVEGVVRSMFLSKVKIAVTGLLVLSLIGSGAGFVAHRTSAGQPASKLAATPVPPEAAGDKAKAKEPEAKPKPDKLKRPWWFAEGMPDRPSVLKAWRDKLAEHVAYPGWNDPKNTLTDVLDDLAKRYNLIFRVNENAFKVDGIVEVGKTVMTDEKPMPPMNASLADILRTILACVPAPSGATFLLRKDHLEITTNTFVEWELGRENDVEKVPEIHAILVTLPENRLMWDAFKDTTIAEILEQIADGNDLNVVTDPRVAKQLQIKATAKFNNVPVETVLRLLLNMADVSMVKVDNVFYLTTEENAKRLREEQAKINSDRLKRGAEPAPTPAPEKPAK